MRNGRSETVPRNVNNAEKAVEVLVALAGESVERQHVGRCISMVEFGLYNRYEADILSLLRRSHLTISTMPVPLSESCVPYRLTLP